jgi:MFS family permease
MTAPYIPIIAIAAATALSLLGDVTLYTVLPSHYSHIGLTPLQVGILLSVHRWVRLISNRLAERCYRVFPVILCLAPAYFLASMATVSYGYFQIFIILFFARILWGVCFSFIRQAGIMTVTTVSSDMQLGKSMGFFRSITLTGWLFGTLLGGFGCDYFGWSFTLITLGIISMGAVPFGIWSQKEIHHVPPSPTTAGAAPLNFKLMLCGFTMGIVGFGLVISTFGLIVKEQIGVSANLWGYSFGVASITGMVLAVRWSLDVLGSPWLGALADRIGRKRFLPIVFFGGSVALVLASLPFGIFWFIGCIMIVFLGSTLLGILIAAWAGKKGGKGIADYATGMDFGMALGPLIGWSIVHFSLPTYLIFIAGAVFYILGGMITRGRATSIST